MWLLLFGFICPQFVISFHAQTTYLHTICQWLKLVFPLDKVVDITCHTMIDGHLCAIFWLQWASELSFLFGIYGDLRTLFCSFNSLDMAVYFKLSSPSISSPSIRKALVFNLHLLICSLPVLERLSSHSGFYRGWSSHVMINRDVYFVFLFFFFNLNFQYLYICYITFAHSYMSLSMR